MDVLLTWSGLESREAASFFHSWLPGVLPGIEPWISDEDIAKGQKWFDALMKQLDKSRVSITFITPANVRSPWVYYESGVIAAKLTDGVVCPYLIGVEPGDVSDTPLGQFQCTRSNQEDSWRLIRSVNNHLPNPHNEQVLEGNFRAQWPKLKSRLGKIAKSMQPITSNVESVEPPVEQLLSPEARDLLITAADSHRGHILCVTTNHGTDMQSGGRKFISDQSPRTVAIWTDALKSLAVDGLVEQKDSDGSVFGVTRSGFDVADLIKGRSGGSQ